MPTLNYTGTVSSSVGLNGTRTVNLVATSTPGANTFTSGSITVTPNFSTTAGSRTFNVTITATFSNGQSYSAAQRISFPSGSYSGYSVAFRISVPEGMSPSSLVSFSARDTSSYSSNIFLAAGSQSASVEYVTPGKCVAPDIVELSRKTAEPAGEAVLSWTSGNGGSYNPIVGYNIYRNGEYRTFVTTTSTTVTAPEELNASYKYTVESCGKYGAYNSGPSTASATLTCYYSAPSAPAAPTLSANSVPPRSTVTLSWIPPSAGTNNEISKYIVLRRVGSGEWSKITETTATRYNVEAPTSNGVAYYYAVIAVGVIAGTQSEMSVASVGLTCRFTAPSKPTTVTGNGQTSLYVDAGDTVIIAWDASADGVNNPVRSYQIFVNSIMVATVDASTFSYSYIVPSIYGPSQAVAVRAVGDWSNSPVSSALYINLNAEAAPPRSTAPVRDFLFFDRNDTLVFIRGDAISVTTVEEEFTLSGAFPYDEKHEITRGLRIGWLEGEELKLYEIRKVKTDAVQLTQTINAEHVAIAELSDSLTGSNVYSAKTAYQVVYELLQDTRWSVGIVNSGNDRHQITVNYHSVWAALCTVHERWECAIRPRVVYTYDGIERKIDILARYGADRGVRLYLDLNASAAGVIYDDTNVVTAAYGFGQKPDSQDAEVDFSSLYWSVDNGDPANKPTGQKWVEDTAATAVYGRHGALRMGKYTCESEDPAYILNKTWEYIQANKTPTFTVEMTALNLTSLGYAWQDMELGDDVTVVFDSIGVERKARVSKFSRDVLKPENSTPTIGAVLEDFVGIVSNKGSSTTIINNSGGGGSGTVTTVDTVQPDGGGNVTLNAVRFSEQELTANQAAQTRANISTGGNGNLLDNWYFPNAVNQRRRYGAFDASVQQVYIYDRWKLTNGNATTDTDGTTVLDGTIEQRLLNDPPFELTASVLVLSGSAVASYNHETQTFSITGSKAEIIAAKLEAGTKQTLYFGTTLLDAPPNYPDEMRRCQYYYMRFRGLNMIAYTGFAITATQVVTVLPLVMRQTPTVTLTSCAMTKRYFSTGAINCTNAGAQFTGSSILIRTNVASGLTVGTNYFVGAQYNTDGTIELSAEF